jgi:molecular chaperone GrpE (heat shock protein)
MVLDSYIKKHLAPVTTAISAHTAAFNTLSEQVSHQSAQISLLFEQILKAQKGFSLQMEEIYDCAFSSEPDAGEAVKPLVAAIIFLRDEIEYLREYAAVRNDEELKRQVDLLIKVCDRKLYEEGIQKIDRENEPYDREMDVVTEVEYGSDIGRNVITKVLSGCYKYQGEIVKRANVIICKGEESYG